MKRNENRKNRNWRNFVVLTLVCMLAATLVGCKTSTAVTPEPSTSEVVSEPVSEPVSEEVLEPVSEEVSEEVVAEPTDEEKIEEIMLGTYENMPKVIDAMKEADISEPKIIIMNANEMKLRGIFADGAYCTKHEGDVVVLYCPNKIDTVSVVPTDITAVDTRYDYSYALSITGQYTDFEVPVTITDVDGNVYELTFYVTTE